MCHHTCKIYRMQITLLLLLFIYFYYITGVWGVGLATPTVSLDTVPLGTDTNSWVLTSEGSTVHNSQTISRGKQKPNEGDIIVSFVNIIYQATLYYQYFLSVYKILTNIVFLLTYCMV